MRRGNKFISILNTINMQLRQAHQSDAPAIAQIHVSTWHAAYEDFVPAAYLNGLSIARRESYWRAAIPAGKPEVIVAETEDGIKGWIAFGPSRDEDSTDTSGEIEAIYVTPAHWARGAGRQLLQDAFTRLKTLGYSEITLWVLQKNENAIRFYNAAGMKPDGIEKDVIMAGETLREVRYSIRLA